MDDHRTPGVRTQEQFNEASAQLARTTEASRNPLAGMATDNDKILAQLAIQGHYREADVADRRGAEGLVGLVAEQRNQFAKFAKLTWPRILMLARADCW